MRPLSDFIDTDFSQAVAGVYGDRLEGLRGAVEWLEGVAETIDDYDLVLGMHTNSNLTSYSVEQKVLFRLGLDLHEFDSDLTRFRKILKEYA